MERYKLYMQQQQDQMSKYKVGHRDTLQRPLDKARGEKEPLTIDQQKKIVNEALQHWRDRDTKNEER